MTDNDNQVCLVVGAGQAGAELAISLRQNGWAGAIKLIGDEGHLPYRRPPLSKAFLAGQIEAEALLIKPAAVYEKNGIELLLSSPATALDTQAHTLTLANGDCLSYSKLALTTGGRVRRLPVQGADKANVFTLRGVEDARRLREYFVPGKRLVIVGGGYIGLEVAAVAVRAGLAVSLLEAAPRVLARVTVPEISQFYERVHREQGVQLRTSVGIERIDGGELAEAVVLSDGERIPCDFVLVGIGLIPNVELAQFGGLAVDNGIVVDLACRTSDADIVAAGDCTQHDNGFLGRRFRLESVQNANDQARVAAATLAGKDAAYQAVPWFWSDQYDLKLQTVGISAGFDRFVLRGDPDAGNFAGFYLKEGVVIAVDTVSRPQEFSQAKILVSRRASVTAERLADESVALKQIVDELALS